MIVLTHRKVIIHLNYMNVKKILFSMTKAYCDWKTAKK